MTGLSVVPGWWSCVRRVLDALPQLLLLCDRHGATLHANRATRHWFQRHAGWSELDPAVRSACERLSALAPSGNGDDNDATAQVSSYTADGWYLVEAVSLGDGEETVRGGVALVVIEPPDAPCRRDAELRGRYNLTPAEMRVAKMLAQGKTNRQISVETRVSIHTVRHHVEHVFVKLGIHTRAAARVALADGRSESAARPRPAASSMAGAAGERDDGAARWTPCCGMESTRLRDTPNREWGSFPNLKHS